MAITCNDVCIPVYQTICAGPIEGLEGEASGSCETTQIGQRCVQICYVTGNPNVPLPGGGGGGSTTPGWGNPADPCDQVNNLKNNTEFKAKMTDLKNKTALTYEAAYTLLQGQVPIIIIRVKLTMSLLSFQYPILLMAMSIHILRLALQPFLLPMYKLYISFIQPIS